MTEHENATLIRRYFDAVHSDPARTAELYSVDVVLHYSGRHRLAGDHAGVEAVLELFRRSREAFRGTQRLEVHDILAGDAHVVALLDASAMLDGRPVGWPRAVVFHIAQGRITEQWIMDGDQALVAEIVGC